MPSSHRHWPCRHSHTKKKNVEPATFEPADGAHTFSLPVHFMFFFFVRAADVDVVLMSVRFIGNYAYRTTRRCDRTRPSVGACTRFAYGGGWNSDREWPSRQFNIIHSESGQASGRLASLAPTHHPPNPSPPPALNVLSPNRISGNIKPRCELDAWLNGSYFYFVISFIRRSLAPGFCWWW